MKRLHEVLTHIIGSVTAGIIPGNVAKTNNINNTNNFLALGKSNDK